MANSEFQQLVDKFQSENIIPDYQDGEILIINNIKNLMPGNAPDHIRPFMNAIVCCKNGKMQLTLNGEGMELQKNQALICPPDAVAENLMFSPDFEFVALCITNQALVNCLRSHIDEWNQILYVKKQRIFTLNEEDIRLAEKANEFLDIALNTHMANCDRGREIIRHMVEFGILGCCAMFSDKIEKENVGESAQKHNVTHFNSFLHLLQSSEQKHQPVRYYASKLCISDKYLTEICKKNSGKTANDWIKEYTLSDIIYYLKNTQLSMKEISIKVGFPNTSFFGKYVKDTLGCTPLEYRRSSQSKP